MFQIFKVLVISCNILGMVLIVVGFDGTMRSRKPGVPYRRTPMDNPRNLILRSEDLTDRGLRFRRCMMLGVAMVGIASFLLFTFFKLQTSL